MSGWDSRIVDLDRAIVASIESLEILRLTFTVASILGTPAGLMFAEVVGITENRELVRIGKAVETKTNMRYSNALSMMEQ